MKINTLERIEKGKRIADSLLGELLLERIGKEVEQKCSGLSGSIQ